MSLGSNELLLYIDNTGELYPKRKQLQTMWAKRWRRGDAYDAEATRRSYVSLVNVGARRYVRELKLTESWNQAFTKADRDQVMREYAARVRSQYKYGELEYLLPEKMRKSRPGNPHPPKNKPKKKRKSQKKKSKPRRRRGRMCPVGTEVQTLIFEKDIFTVTQAKAWARRNGYSVSKVDETEESYRLRQKDPKRYQRSSFRTIAFGDVKAVIGCPK